MVKKCSACGFDNRDDANFCASCGSSLAAPPTVKPVPSVRVVSPVAPPGPIRISPPGMCYYHSNLPAGYICARCGRAICRDCAKCYNGLVLCSQCYSLVAIPEYAPPPPTVCAVPAAVPTTVPMPAPAPAPAPAYVAAPPPVPTYPPARALWGFIISLIAGILIIINAAALISAGFYATLVGIFPWIAWFGAPPPWLLVVIGLILGIIVCIGALLMVLGYGTIGSVVVFPAAIISLVLGGGFVAGFVLGIVGGIMGMLGR
ncbi:zinc-ribbon domain-containing protein [Candidatus Bathyarchaeota archaeon]|nr:zinc-ribbon domain-containing protein [Candidatus Bathyarchaeota archaeon]